MRQLATIQQIADIQPIEGADAIEKVKILGWWCVAKKGEFACYSWCVYFEIDSLLPSAHPAFEFLKDRSREVTIATETGTASGYRLRTIRLRGQISQGLALPIKSFPELIEEAYADGQDVSETIGVFKWEPPISKQMASKAAGNFPGFIPKTDEERVQNLGSLVARHAGKMFYVTEKLDGSSLTAYRTEERFGVCSRSWDLLEGNLFWDMARAAGIEERLPVGYAVQGEIIGPSIQDNRLKLAEKELYLFNVYDLNAGAYLEFMAFCIFCETHKFKHVPIVHMTLFLPNDVDGLVQMADGKSLLNPECDREGLVFRPWMERVDDVRGSQRRVSFKAISNRYLLKEK